MAMLALFADGARPASAASGEFVDCPGCLEHPLHECAACGARAVVALPCGEHAMSLCRSCWDLVRQLRGQVRSETQAAASKALKARHAAAAAAKSAQSAEASPASPPAKRSRRCKVAAVA